MKTSSGNSAVTFSFKMWRTGEAHIHLLPCFEVNKGILDEDLPTRSDENPVGVIGRRDELLELSA
jgi:hypothetical protein